MTVDSSLLLRRSLIVFFFVLSYMDIGYFWAELDFALKTIKTMGVKSSSTLKIYFKVKRTKVSIDNNVPRFSAATRL